MGEGLGAFLAHARLQDLPAVMETPGPDDHGPDERELQKVRELHARWAPARRPSRRSGSSAGPAGPR
jgi:hypothetical protein